MFVDVKVLKYVYSAIVGLVLISILLAASLAMYNGNFCNDIDQCVRPLYDNATSSFQKVSDISTVAVNMGALGGLLIASMNYPQELMLCFGIVGRGLYWMYAHLPDWQIPTYGGVLGGTQTHVRGLMGQQQV